MSLDEPRVNRRTFLQSTAAVGAGLFVSSTGLAQAAGGDQINVGLIGAGSQGQVLINACLKMRDPNIRFKAVCDIWEEYNLRKMVRMLQKYRYDVTGYVDYKQMLAEQQDLDAVIIATPDFWHAEHAVACLQKGLHVYCEKEMSNTLEGAKQMVEAQKATGKLLQIGHQRRSNPRYIHCYDKLLKEANILGRITTINAQWNRAARPDNEITEKYHIDPATLHKYGFKDMHQFLNWRWFKGLGGGPIVDLGSHQIDIFNWFLESQPVSVMASGGLDYYSKDKHDWYDTVMAIYEYDTPQGKVRAFYQTLTTNSSNGYYENFLGDQGTLSISESSSRGAVYREPSAPDWEKWAQAGILAKPEEEEAASEEETALLDVRESPKPPAWEIPVEMNKKYHQPHLENFFAAVRGRAKLNCPAEIGYETAVAVLKVNEAIKAQKRLEFTPGEFTA